MNTTQLLAKRADHKTAHVLHLLLSLVTAGLWVPIWVLVAVSHSMERAKIDRKLSRTPEAEALRGMASAGTVSAADFNGRLQECLKNKP